MKYDLKFQLSINELKYIKNLAESEKCVVEAGQGTESEVGSITLPGKGVKLEYVYENPLEEITIKINKPFFVPMTAAKDKMVVWLADKIGREIILLA